LLAGSNIARRLSLKQGSKIRIGTREFTITGIISTGDREDDALVGELDTVQAILGLQGKVSRVMVSALTTPMDDFAYRDPEKMSAAEYEKWYCTGYVTSIAKQLTEVFRSGKAKPVWPIAETEGKVLRKLSLLIYLLSFFTLLAAALGVSTTMVMSLLRRTEEIALMKATGADTGKIILIFLSEATITGMSGGTIGLILSLSITTYIGKEVFGTGLARPFILIPISLLMAMVISILGALLPIRKAIRIKPAVVLKGGGI
jgi:putative ABC transport system permease protein